jgi:hypothetical protein
MAHYPNNNEFLNGWIRSTVRNLLRYDADMGVITHVFGNQVIADIQERPNFPERTYGEAFYGDFHHPNAEFRPYTRQLMALLPFHFLLEHLSDAGSYRSWVDLRDFVTRPEFTPEVLNHLMMLAETPREGLSLDEILRLPSRETVAELYRLVNP